MVPSPPSTRSLRPVRSSVGPWRRTRSIGPRRGSSFFPQVRVRSGKPAVGNLLAYQFATRRELAFSRTSSRVPIRRVCFPVERLTSRKVPVHQRKARAHQRRLFVFCFSERIFRARYLHGLMRRWFLALRVQVDRLPVRAYSQVICLPMKNRNDLSCCKVRWTC
jgi:hypothetical protein